TRARSSPTECSLSSCRPSRGRRPSCAERRGGGCRDERGADDDDPACGDGRRRFQGRFREQPAAHDQPGDTVLVHAGEYREWVQPRRGGLSATRRITYQAAPGEHVVVKGSERVTGW